MACGQCIENWNPDYRINHVDVVGSGTAPCKTACPAHIAVQEYVKLASQGKYQEALELIKKENPLPAVCGRICNRRCEDACSCGNVDEPIAIIKAMGVEFKTGVEVGKDAFGGKNA